MQFWIINLITICWCTIINVRQISTTENVISKDFTTNILQHWTAFKEFTERADAVLIEHDRIFENMFNQNNAALLDLLGFDINNLSVLNANTQNYVNQISNNILAMIACITTANQNFQKLAIERGTVFSTCASHAQYELSNIELITQFQEYMHSIQHQSTTAQNAILLGMQVFNPVTQQGVLDNFLGDSLNSSNSRWDDYVQEEIQYFINAVDIQSRNIITEASMCLMNNWLNFIFDSNRLRNEVAACIVIFNQSINN